MAEPSEQPVQEVQTGVEAPVEARTETTANLTTAYLDTIRNVGFTPTDLKPEPGAIDTGNIWKDLGLDNGIGGNQTGEVQLARLEPERKSGRGNEDDPVKARIIEKGTEEAKGDASFYKDFIREMNAKIHEGIKNGDPTALAAEVSRFFGTLQGFENKNLSEGLRKDSFIANAVSGATLNQFGETLAGESKDGKPVSMKYDEHARTLNISIGETGNQVTMTIDSKGQIQMSDGSDPGQFVKRLKPFSGGNDTV